MSDNNDYMTCFFREKGYTGQCPFVGHCDCDDCLMVELAVKKAIKVVTEKKHEEESRIDDLDEPQTPDSSVLYELHCDEDNEHSEV